MPIDKQQGLWQDFQLRSLAPPPEPWQNRVPPWVWLIGGMIAGAILFAAGAISMRLHG